MIEGTNTEIVFVAKNESGLYLDADEKLTNKKEKAYEYLTGMVFSDGGRYGCKTYLRFPNGFEIEIQREYFKIEEEKCPDTLPQA